MEMKSKKISAVYAFLSIFASMLILCSFFYPWYEWNYNEEARGKIVYSDGSPDVNYWYDKSEGSVEYNLLDYKAVVITDGDEAELNENYESVEELSSFIFTLILMNTLGLLISIVIFVLSVMSYTGTSVYINIKNIKLIMNLIIVVALILSLLAPLTFYTNFTSNAMNPIFSTATHGESIYELAGTTESLTGNGTRTSEPAENCFSNNLLGCKITSDWKPTNGWYFSISAIIPITVIFVLMRIYPLQIESNEASSNSAPPRPPELIPPRPPQL